MEYRDWLTLIIYSLCDWLAMCPLDCTGSEWILPVFGQHGGSFEAVSVRMVPGGGAGGNCETVHYPTGHHVFSNERTCFDFEGMRPHLDHAREQDIGADGNAFAESGGDILSLSSSGFGAQRTGPINHHEKVQEPALSPAQFSVDEPVGGH